MKPDSWSSRDLADTLRQILQQLEDAEGVDPSSHSFLRLKDIMLEKIAIIETGRVANPKAADLN